MRAIDVSFKDVEIGGTFFAVRHGGKEIEQFIKVGSEIGESIFLGGAFFNENDNVKIEIDEGI